MVVGIVLVVAAMCMVPVAYSIGKDVGYGDGYEDAVDDVLRQSKEEHYLTD